MGLGLALLQTKTPELPPGSMCIHSMCSTKFSYCFSLRITPMGWPEQISRPLRHRPRVFGGIDVDPARQIPAVEERLELPGRLTGDSRRGKETAQEVTAKKRFIAAQPITVTAARDRMSPANRLGQRNRNPTDYGGELNRRPLRCWPGWCRRLPGGARADLDEYSPLVTELVVGEPDRGRRIPAGLTLMCMLPEVVGNRPLITMCSES